MSTQPLTTQPPIATATAPMAPAEPRPLLVLQPGHSWDLSAVTDVWHYRDLLLVLAARDVKLRYRQTALGVAWVLIQPLLGAGIFQVLFGLLAKTPSDGVPPFVFYFAGFMAYRSFDSTLNKASSCMVGNAHLVSKVYFPRLILPLSTVCSTLVDFAVSAGLLTVLMAVFHVSPTPALLLLPVWLLLLQMVALGIGFYGAALTVRYRDVQHALPVLIQFGLYASPVAYSVSFALQKLPEALRPLVYLNPLSGLIDAFRWSVLGTPVTSWALVAYSAVAALVVFAWGALSFNRMEQSFADVI